MVEFSLNRPVTMMELQQVINQMKLGKTQGQDGLPAKYQDCLMQPLKDTMSRILKTGNIPDTWKNVYITLIPKQDSDLTLVKNYKPISLLR